MAFTIEYSPGSPPAGWPVFYEEARRLLGDRISTDISERLSCGKDFWPITGAWFMEGRMPSLPDAVAWPETTDEVSAILKLANEYRIPVVPYGEGSGVLGGALAIRGGIVLDMKRMNRILELDEKSLLVTVQTGINGEVLERELSARGYTLRHIPQSIRCSTVGGWIACRAAGQFSSKYGKIEDMLVSLEAVLPDGNIYRSVTVPRNAAGPRLDHLFLGAEGTLGVVTCAVLRIWPLPQEQALSSYAFPGVDEALEAVRLIMRDNIRPAVVRIYDRQETGHHFHNIPEAADRVMLILVMEGIPELVAVEQQVTHRHCLASGGVPCGPEPVRHWFETRFDVSISAHLLKAGAVVDTIEVAGIWSNISSIYHRVTEAIKAVPGTVVASGHFSHVYPDGACLYLSVVGMPGENKDEYYQRVWDAAMNTTRACGGSISHHHGIGLNRGRFMESEHGRTGLSILAALKKALDPCGIMNPGKLGMEVDAR